jgi:hypothetical protein
MDLSAWWDSFAGYWGSSDGQSLLREVLLPGIAIVVSTLIAVFVLAAQLSANRRQLRGALIETLMERLAEVSVQAEIRHEQLKSGQPPLNSLRSAMKYFDASVSALRFSLPRTERGVVDFVRNAVHENSLDEQDSFALMADSDRALRYLESWALGRIPAREFRTYNRFSSGATRPPEFQELWAGLARRMKEGYDREGGPVEYAKYKRTRTYRVIRRRARFHYRTRDRVWQFCWELRNPSKAPAYREARAAMRANEL